MTMMDFDKRIDFAYYYYIKRDNFNKNNIYLIKVV